MRDRGQGTVVRAAIWASAQFNWKHLTADMTVACPLSPIPNAWLIIPPRQILPIERREPRIYVRILVLQERRFGEEDFGQNGEELAGVLGRVRIDRGVL